MTHQESVALALHGIEAGVALLRPAAERRPDVAGHLDSIEDALDHLRILFHSEETLDNH